MKGSVNILYLREVKRIWILMNLWMIYGEKL